MEIPIYKPMIYLIQTSPIPGTYKLNICIPVPASISTPDQPLVDRNSPDSVVFQIDLVAPGEGFGGGPEEPMVFRTYSLPNVSLNATTPYIEVVTNLVTPVQGNSPTIATKGKSKMNFADADDWERLEEH